MRAALLTAAVLLATSSAQTGEGQKTLIAICAPGYPGTSAEAQPSLDAFADATARAAGWPAGSLGAIYEPTEKGSLARLAQKEVAMTYVPLPFWVKHGRALGLEPRLQVVPQGASSPTEVWALVAKKGRVASPAALAGFTLASTAGYAPAFVRGALAGFGSLPESVKIVESPQVLSQLRKAASGAEVAVLLDGTQLAALSSLPFAAELEVVARSEPLPIAFVARVDKRLPAARLEALEKAMLKLSEPAGAEALQAIRMSRILPVDAAALAQARRVAGTTP